MADQELELFPHESIPESAEEQAKRDDYRRRLAEYLKDPAFRAIEGFPIGTDEDILALSDPPYYTACPNPFLPEIIEQWLQEREDTRLELGLKDDRYQREPFAADVSEGKNDPIYNAHSYHTKVPHKAIMRYILHYTDPGDIVFDGFCGTGMTGVAAQLCGDKKAVEELGFRVDEEDVVWEGNKAISRLGVRKAVLNDLSPAATFIAYNYNTPVDATAFEKEAKRILAEVEKECGWMYETWHPNCDASNRVKGKINYTVWSDVFVCPNCGQEMIFWDVAANPKTGELVDKWECPNCKSFLAKNPRKGEDVTRAERAYETKFDRSIGITIKHMKQVPALISYIVGKKHLFKKPDFADITLTEEIENKYIPYPFPNQRMPEGDESRRNDDIGITHVHHFYTKRNLWELACFAHKQVTPSKYVNVISVATIITKMYRFRSQNNSLGAGGGPLAGTLYVPSLTKEIPIHKALGEHIAKTTRLRRSLQKIELNTIGTGSHTNQSTIPTNTSDYIFTDPPFGGNIMYSDLNYITEAWLKVWTNNDNEAVISKIQDKRIDDYQKLMLESFQEAFKVLKPGRWMTIEFHNSQNSVWNSIQEALTRSGFVIADVRVLDKQQTTFKQVSTTSAVKQDLIISVYKPNGNLEERFKLKAGTEDGAWEFVRYHLSKLPVINQSGKNVIVNAERQAFLLFDRMVAFHVQRGVMVPISSPEFYTGLEQRFTRRDGMYFLPDQVTEYDRAVLESGKPTQLSLFVSDEKTATAWLRQQLDPSSAGEPKTQGDLTNDFNRIMNRAKHEKPLELIEILELNFLQDETGKWYVPDHNKASDLEKVRQRTLLKEFKDYANSTGRLRMFRTEAIRAGFADCFKRQDFATLIKVAERLPENVLREDPDLLMYYDSALLRKK